jgi:hypothetical protein
MSNPFINRTITIYDEKLNDEVSVDILNISKYFKHIYCLCLLNDKDEIDASVFINEFINETDNKDLLNDTMNKMILYKVNISILKNYVHYGNICYCPKEIVSRANKFGYDFDNQDNVLILPIYNISFLNLQKYIDNINGSITFNNFYDIMVMNNYFGDKMNDLLKLKIYSMINNFDESKYWELPYNCMPNITKLFDTRKFNFNIIRTAPNISNILDRIDNSPLKENYIEQIFNRRNYVDPSEIINKKGYKLYWKVWNSDYNNDSINKLFDILDNNNENYKYLLFSSLCVSKKYCHLVINNEYIIKMMTPVINQNNILYSYLFGYAWLRFYFEETINRFRVKTTDMYIFDINTASALPVFYFDYKNPHNNPYCPILVANKSLNPEINIVGVICNTDMDLDRRICNLNEFKDKMNIFISGYKNIDLLGGIDFKELKIAITGSIMTACSQYNHPLMNLFLNIPENERDKRFFDEYYYESDIDIMVMSKTVYEFLDITKSFHEKIMLNCCQYLNAEPEHIKYNLLRNTYLFVSSDFIKEHICNDKLTYEIIIKGLELKLIIKLFAPYAKKMHEMECKKKIEGLNEEDKLKLMDKYAELFIFEEDKLVIKVKDTKTNTTMINNNVINKPLESEFSQEEIEMILNSNNNLDEEKINIIIPMTDGLGFSDGFKVRITAPQLRRDFELFPVFKDDFMNTVANFHMPCVRAYYNGDNVYMTPSFVSAHMTLMNIDYKYFAGSKDPINIINKYRMRGFGCWLNKNELETYIKYNYEVPFWNNIFNISPTNKNSYNKCYGALNMHSNMFKPRMINSNLINGEKTVPVEFNYSHLDFRVLSEQEYNLSKFKSDKIFDKRYTAINKDTGYIEPLFKDIITINTYLKKTSINLIDTIPEEQEQEWTPANSEIVQPAVMTQLEVIANIVNDMPPFVNEDIEWGQNIAVQAVAIQQATEALIVAAQEAAQADVLQAQAIALAAIEAAEAQIIAQETE